MFYLCKINMFITSPMIKCLIYMIITNIYDSNYGNNGYKSITIFKMKYKIIINYIIMILAYMIFVHICISIYIQYI